MNKHEIIGKLQEHMFASLELYKTLCEITRDQKPLSGDIAGEVYIRLCYQKDWPDQFTQSDCGPLCGCKTK